ncbi:MAG: Clp protease N-terminal domain-containing protein [Acidimicrobiia bacterium]
MFERFTERARRVVVLSQEEARLLNHDYIGTEHILLGVVAEGESIGARALESLDASLEAVRRQVREIVGFGPHALPSHIPFTPKAKKALEMSLREAIQLGDQHIGPEHILLGLLRDEDGVAVRALLGLGVDLTVLRSRVIELATARPPVERRATPEILTPAPQSSTACAFCGRDVWDVEHYVAGERAVICEQCLMLGRTVVETARQTGQPVGQPLFLPPRVFGDAPGPDATGDIVEAFGSVFTSRGDRARAAAHLEDGERLVPLLDEAAARHPQVSETRLRIERVRYLDPSTAQVRFTIMPGGLGSFPFEGHAIERDDRWLVSRDTFCEILARGGVICPPRDD